LAQLMSPPKAASPAATLAAAVTKAGVKQYRKPKLTKLTDERHAGLTGIIFGKSGSGKTDFFVQLLLNSKTPVRAIYVQTDIGAGGFATIKARLKEHNRLDLLDNVMVLDIGGHHDDRGNEISGYEELSEFLNDPWSEDLLAFDPNVFFWDGFGSFQGIDIVDYVLDKGVANNASDLREANLIAEKVGKDQSWEARKRATVRAVDKFGQLRRPDGKLLHKFLTMFEASRQVPVDSNNPTAGSKQELTGLPLMSGFGVFDQIKGAADFVLKTKVVVKEGGKVFEYSYITGGPENVEGKVRGPRFDVSIPADAAAFFDRIVEACDVGEGVA
jgi:hypothetical protein